MNKQNDYIQVEFLGIMYGIRYKNGQGLDDLVYDLKLNDYINEDEVVNDLSDLKEQFNCRTLFMEYSDNYDGYLCENCNLPLFDEDSLYKVDGRIFCIACGTNNI